MRTIRRALGILTALAVAQAWAPGRLEANAAGVMFLMLNDEGEAQQVLPRASAEIRMAAERVVLIPFLDPRGGRAQVLVSARYDLVSEKSHHDFPVGYPEVKGAHAHSVSSNWIRSARKLDLGQPSIGRLSAWAGGRRLAVREHPGVARYRRWFTFGVPLPARQSVPLRVRYVSQVGRSLRLLLTDAIGFRSPGLYTWADYWIDYVLHTGSAWAGPIGQGEILLFAEGRHHTLKRFQNLRPTPKDDLTIKLALGRIALPKAVQEELERERVTRWERSGKIDELDTLRLVQSSSELSSGEVESLGALAVDGDPASGWISAPRQAMGAWLRLPADPGRRLGSLQLLTLTRAGVSRPARIEVRCLSRHRGALRGTLLSTTALPDAPGPHRLPTPGAAACAALQVNVLAVHGKVEWPVGIAEIEQRYTTPPKGAPLGVELLPCCYQRAPAKLCRPVVRMGGGCLDTVRVLRPALQAARPAIAKIPPGHLGFGYEIARISDVRWSADGTVAHYRLWLENEHHEPAAVLMGHFVEVATGRVLGRYRLDQVGILPEPERRQWKDAMSFEAGEGLLRKHGFSAALLGRAPPARTGQGAGPRPVEALGLRGAMPPVSGRLSVKPRKTGFSWWYEPNLYTSAQQRSLGTLELIGSARGRGPRPLTLRRPALEHGFAQQHQRVRDRRRQLVAKSLSELNVKADPAVTLASLFPRVHAFMGEARFYWHPGGRAVLVVWQDEKDLSALLPDSLVELDVELGGGELLPLRAFDRLDYARGRASVTLHPLAPTPRTTLSFSPP